MSHHLDSPLSRRDPRLNITDFYVFGTSGATVFVMNVNTSLAGGEHGFRPDSRYEIHLHRGDEPEEAVTYRVSFTPSSEGWQTYVVTRHTATTATEGEPVASGHTGSQLPVAEGATVAAWAGQCHDPFYLDLRQLKAFTAAMSGDGAIGLGAPADAASTFGASLVQSIVLQLPHDDLLSPGQRIRAWASTSAMSHEGSGWSQVNRAGLPMIWPIFRPDDSDEASVTNEGHPRDDKTAYEARISAQIRGLTSSRTTVADPEGYGAALAQRLLPDTLPYLVGSQASFDLLAFNGRDLRDNAPEVMFTLVLGAAVSTGLRPDAASCSSAFPYVIPAANIPAADDMPAADMPAADMPAPPASEGSR